MPGTSGSLPLSIGPGEKKNLERSSSLSIVGFSFFSQAGCVPGPDQPPSCSAQRRDRLQARNTRQPHGPAGVVLGHTETIPHSFSSFLLQITFVSMHVEILELTSSDKILELVNTRPQVNRCGHSIIYFFVLRSFCLRLCLSCRGVRWTSSSGCLPSSSPSGRTP